MSGSKLKRAERLEIINGLAVKLGEVMTDSDWAAIGGMVCTSAADALDAEAVGRSDVHTLNLDSRTIFMLMSLTNVGMNVVAERKSGGKPLR